MCQTFSQREKSPEESKPCWKNKLTRAQAQLHTARTNDSGGQRRAYFCAGCDAWHTTSQTDASRRRRAEQYRKPSPGSRGDWRRWR